MIEGLFGVDLHAGRLDLRLRLDRSGSIRLHEPATNRSVDLRYRAELRRLVLDVDTNATVGQMAVLLPRGMRVAEARVGDASSAFTTETVGEDIYAVVGGGMGPLHLELLLDSMHVMRSEQSRARRFCTALGAQRPPPRRNASHSNDFGLAAWTKLTGAQGTRFAGG